MIQMKTRKKSIVILMIVLLSTQFLMIVYAPVDSHITEAIGGGNTNTVFGANQYSTSIIYSNNRYWFVGVEEDSWDIWIYNSTDGINWNGSELDPSDLYHTNEIWTYNTLYSCIDDDGNIHVAWYAHTVNHVYYKKVYPSIDGTIETNATVDVVYGVLMDFILDGAGYPVIYFNGPSGGYIQSSSVNNGSWITDYNQIIESGRQTYGQITPVKITSNRDIIIVYQWDTGGYREYFVKSYRYVGGLSIKFALDNLLDLINIEGDDWTYWSNLLDAIYDDEYTFVLCYANKTGYGKSLVLYEIHSQNDGTIIIDDWYVIYNNTDSNDYLGYSMRLDQYGNLIVYYKHDNINGGNETYFFNVLSYNGDIDSDWWYGQTFQELFNVNDTYRPDGFREGYGDWSVTQSGLDYEDIRIVYAKDIHGIFARECVHINYGVLNMGVPFAYYNTTLYNSDGNLNDGWLFKGDIYTIVSYFKGADIFYLNFTDGQHEILLRFDNSTGIINIITGERFVLGEIYSNYTKFSNDVQRINITFIPDINIVDIANTTVYYNLYNEEMNMTIDGSTGLIFNIYNLGGFTYYTFVGDGGRIPYGSPFSLSATDGALSSTARAEQIFRKLQHISFLMEIDMSNEWDAGNGVFDIDAGVGYVDIGIDYRLNGSWVEGFKLRIYVQDANVGHHNLGIDHDWVEWSIDFWNYDPSTGYQDNLQSQLIYSNHWGYEHENYVPDYYNRTSSQLWIDLWFDKTNASTAIAAQVNAYYHGLKEQGASWWFGYGDFIPMISNYDNAKFLDDLYDEGGNITNVQKFDLMKFYIEVGKANIVDGNDEPWLIRGIEDMHREQAIDRMEGIDEPTFVETKVLDMPQTGFINAIKSAINGLSSAIWKGAFQFVKLMMGAVGSLMDAIGLGEWWRAFTTAMENIAAYSLGLMDNLQIALVNSAILLEQLFEVISTTFTRFILGLTSFLSGILTWYREIVNLFTGGGIWNINVWVTLELGDWVGLIINLLPVWWFIRIAESDDKISTLQGDIGFVVMITTGLFHFLSSIIILGATLINLLLGLLPI